MHDDVSEIGSVDRLRVAALAGDARALEDLVRVLEPFVMRRCARFLPHRGPASTQVIPGWPENETPYVLVRN